MYFLRRFFAQLGLRKALLATSAEEDPSTQPVSVTFHAGFRFDLSLKVASVNANQGQFIPDVSSYHYLTVAPGPQGRTRARAYPGGTTGIVAADSDEHTLVHEILGHNVLNIVDKYTEVRENNRVVASAPRIGSEDSVMGNRQSTNFNWLDLWEAVAERPINIRTEPFREEYFHMYDQAVIPIAPQPSYYNPGVLQKGAGTQNLTKVGQMMLPPK